MAICVYCGKFSGQRHAANCPSRVGGVKQPSVYSRKKKKNGAYLRRSRKDVGQLRLGAYILYLVETRQPEADTPAGLYWEDHVFPHQWSQPK